MILLYSKTGLNADRSDFMREYDEIRRWLFSFEPETEYILDTTYYVTHLHMIVTENWD